MVDGSIDYLRKDLEPLSKLLQVLAPTLLLEIMSIILLNVG